MTTSVFIAGWAVAVFLALYAFHCFWEAGRADLHTMSRGHGLQIAGTRVQLPPGLSPAAYRLHRARARRADPSPLSPHGERSRKRYRRTSSSFSPVPGDWCTSSNRVAGYIRLTASAASGPAGRYA
jgi:hypothetical protein